MSDRPGTWALKREERRQLALSLLQRADAPTEAREAFRRQYPLAPGKMIDRAVHHVYVDGPDAVLNWLADAELFLRDPNHQLSFGVTCDLLYHVYNWLQFKALLPEGKPGLLERLKELKEFADEGALDAVKATVNDITEMLEGNVGCPDFDSR